MNNENKKFITLAAAVLVMGGAGLAVAFTTAAKKPAQTPAGTEATSKPKFPVTIHRPEPPRIFTGRTNHAGEPVTVSCATCHTTTTPNIHLRDAAELKQFHQGMKFNHGELSCVSCHNEKDYDTLRLADGSSVDFSNSMQLCGQCHGPQARDYRNGAHGGMSGYWDLTRGPRERNTCTDCHDPHSPAYPVVMPVFKPQPAERTANPKKAH